MIDYLALFASLEDPARTWEWRGQEHEVRDALYRSLEAEQAAAATVAYPGEAARILALAQSAFGDLRGLLAGLPDELLDQEPKPAEWPLRATLRHTMLVELGYRANTLYAISRGDGDPVRLPPELRPTEAEVDAKGGIGEILERFAGAREASDGGLGSVEPEAMLRPTLWGGSEVDVRFRLHRFGGHIAEHTIQCEKTLAWLGRAPSEARLVTRRISSLRGLHERHSDPHLIGRLDEANRALARSLASL